MPDASEPKQTHPAVALAFSPDGQFLVNADSDRDIRVYDAQSDNLNLKHTLAGHSLPIIAVGFGDNDFLISVSLDQTVVLWDIGSGKLLQNTELNFGKQLVPAIAPDAMPLFAGGTGKQVRLWNYRSGKLLNTFEVNDSNVSALAFTPYARRLVIGTHKGVIRVMDVLTWKLEGTVDLDVPVGSLAATADQILVGCGDGVLHLLSLGEQTSVPHIKARDRSAGPIAFNGKGNLFAAAAERGTIKVWDSKTLNLLCTLDTHFQEIQAIAFSPDGQRIAASGTGGKVACWRLPANSRPGAAP